jgi:hypothetical protein
MMEGVQPGGSCVTVKVNAVNADPVLAMVIVPLRGWVEPV